MFPISRDPPEGGTYFSELTPGWLKFVFPISRDPPEGGTTEWEKFIANCTIKFPISRDPPEGGTWRISPRSMWSLDNRVSNF